jgi:hypothetical protein
MAITRKELNALAEVKLAEIKAKYVTMQDHAELRRIVGARPSEAIRAVQLRYAMRLAMIESGCAEVAPAPASASAELLDVDALLANEPAEYTCRGTENEGLAGNCPGCTNCTPPATKVYTAAAFLSSPEFLRIATEDAVKLVAKTNNQTYELTLYALAVQTPSVVAQVATLVTKAAQHCADEANAGRLWAQPSVEPLDKLSAVRELYEVAVQYATNPTECSLSQYAQALAVIAFIEAEEYEKALAVGLVY